MSTEAVQTQKREKLVLFHLKINKIIQEFKPSGIVHCAAQRFPDKVEKDKDGTIQLNINATKHLATKAGKQAMYQNNNIQINN